MKKTLVILTAAMLTFSPLAYAGGGKGYQGGGKGYAGTTGRGTLNQTRLQNRDGSLKGPEASNGKGDVTRTRDRKRDGSCN